MRGSLTLLFAFDIIFRIGFRRLHGVTFDLGRRGLLLDNLAGCFTLADIHATLSPFFKFLAINMSFKAMAPSIATAPSGSSVQRCPLAANIVRIFRQMDVFVDMVDPFERDEVVLSTKSFLVSLIRDWSSR